MHSRLPSHLYRLALLAGLVQTLIGVANGFVVRGIARTGELLPSQLTMLRLVGTAAVIVPIWAIFPSRRPPLHPVDWRAAAGLGLLGVTANQAVYIAGVAQSTPARAVLIYALVPLLVLICGAVRGYDMFSWRLAAAVAVGFLGVFIIIAERKAGVSNGTGDLLLLCGCTCWALFTAGAQPLLRKYGALPVTEVALVAGGVAALPLAWPVLHALAWQRVSVQTWVGIAYLVFAASMAAYWLWYFAIKHLSPSRAVMFNYLQPFLATLATTVFLHEPLTTHFVVGGAFILVSLRLTHGAQRPLPATAPARSGA